MNTDPTPNLKGPDQLAPCGGLSSADLLAVWRAAEVTIPDSGSDTCRFCDEYRSRIIRHGVCDSCWDRIGNVIEEELDFQSANSGGVSRPDER